MGCRMREALEAISLSFYRESSNVYTEAAPHPSACLETAMYRPATLETREQNGASRPEHAVPYYHFYYGD